MVSAVRVHKIVCHNAKCYLSLVAFAFLMLSCGGRATKGDTQEPKASIVIDLADTQRVDTLHFGRVRAGEVVEMALALRNGSSAPIVPLATETSCGCLEMELPKEPIAAGGAKVVKMFFYSSGYNYFPPRTFYIKTSAGTEPKRLVVRADME